MSEITYKQLIAIIKQDGLFELDWQAASDPISPQVQEVQQHIYDRFISEDPALFFSFAFIDQSDDLSVSLRYLTDIATMFLRSLALNPDLESLREQARAELDEEVTRKLLDRAPYMYGLTFLNEQWIAQAWDNLQQSYSNRLQTWAGSMEELLLASNAHIQFVGRIYFHLVENKELEEYPFSFMATYAAEPDATVKSRHLPLKNALIEYEGNNDKLLQLLSTVHKAAAGSSLITELLDSGDIFHPIGLYADEAYTFLTEVSLYESAGILCRIPRWWKNKSRDIKVNVTIGGKEPVQLGADTLLNFDATLWLGNEKSTEEELRQLLLEAEGLTFLKGKWVEVDHTRLQKALAAYEHARNKFGSEHLTIADAMRMQLNSSQVIDMAIDSEVEFEITNGQWLDSVQSKLLNPSKLESTASPGDSFHASLRPYQELGLNWLLYMKTLGIGACLADDMGLGKTIQIIAMLNSIRSERQEHALLIVPASLIGNWIAELKRFAPSLNYYVWHPSVNKNLDETEDGTMLEIEKYDLMITTYGMLLKYDWISQVRWNTLILDEAQAIKNPSTKQTRAVKKIKATAKIAMTGTPVENRLSDLWSLFDFLNKGMLGTAKEFTAFSKRMREQPEGYQRLKQTVSPFILRRLKTDKLIISDLPDKIEMKTYSTLTKKQALLYNMLVQDLEKKLQDSEKGIQRRGLILSSLMKFKQICNHPDQYLGQEVYRADESGKFARLQEICETILEKRERVLVFTQFKEMTEPLRRFLEQIFQHEGMVLHGGTPIARRQEIVAAFQGERYVPFLVLSIKAGGVGLNLTKANHVIHFDRWWNPAVENQATDRAFRIGQQNNVIVHKFVMQGTIEEKIDQIIEEKIKLTKDIIPDLQENWITEMNNTELIELMKLS